MSRLRLLSAATLLAMAANANASSLIITTDSIVGALKSHLRCRFRCHFFSA